MRGIIKFIYFLYILSNEYKYNLNSIIIRNILKKRFSNSFLLIHSLSFNNITFLKVWMFKYAMNKKVTQQINIIFKFIKFTSIWRVFIWTGSLMVSKIGVAGFSTEYLMVVDGLPFTLCMCVVSLVALSFLTATIPVN